MPRLRAAENGEWFFFDVSVSSRGIMQTSYKSLLAGVVAILMVLCTGSAVAFGAGKPHYVVTNDDVPPELISTISFYTVGTNGQLTMKAKVLVGEGGIAGGYFAAN